MDHVWKALPVTGTVTLNGGTINVNFLPGYTPADGDHFTVLISQRGVINGSPGDFNIYTANGLDLSYQMSDQVSGGRLTQIVSAVGGASGGIQDAGRTVGQTPLSGTNPIAASASERSLGPGPR